MSRPIKFRAWDGKEMHYLSEPYLDGNLGVMRMDYMKLPDTNAIKLMQFTGLLDKNGKEIWEGDIVKTTSERPKIVYWYEEWAQFRIGREGDKTQFDKTDTMFWAKNWEVLGNIYENPELLK